MSVFGRATFNASAYALGRPSYPPSLFKTVLQYYNAKNTNGTLLDLGCGHGLISRELSPHFSKVIALDPSAGMIKQAKEMTKDAKIEFRQGNAEDLSFLSDQSLDLAVAGQAAHWFDYNKFWPELSRVVKPGGCMGFWGYKDNIIVGHSEASKVLDRFSYGEEEVAPGWESMNQYWERPGRDMLRRLLKEVEPPVAEWEDVKRILGDVSLGNTDTLSDDVWMRAGMSLGDLQAYVRTFSCYRGWKDAHPEVKSREEGGDGDIADLLIERMLEVEPRWKAQGSKWREIPLETAWGTYIILARRRR